jgi:hypothetical protein
VIAGRRNFKELDLSENLLGSHEFALKPHETAGMALGSLLSDPRCTMETLNLSWNMLRFQSGIELVRAIRVNTSLTHLDLSYNRLCAEGGDALGNALHANRTLRVLKLAHNNITSRPCCTILSGVVSCESLTEVDLCKNPIGELGARLLLSIDLKYGDRVKVDIRNCQLRVRDTSCWFDPVKPKKEYTLHLADPYERCVCIEVLRLVANPSSDHAIEQYHYKAPEDSEFRDLELDIYSAKNAEGGEGGYVSPREAELKLEEARNMYKETANRIFRQYDTDGSGGLDRHELATILEQIGMEGSNLMVHQLMSIYDTDGSGLVEEEEFVAFLMDIKSSSMESANLKASDRFVYVKSEASTKGKPPLYFPPEVGTVHLKLNSNSTKEISPQHISRRSVETMLDATKSSEDRAAIFDYALSVMRLQFSDAQTFYRVMLKELGSAHQVLVRLIPRMSTPNDARLLIAFVTDNDFEHLHALRQALGPLYSIYIGLPNGFYRLNLSEEPDQRCLKALIELSNSSAAHRKRVGLGDTSQEGNWTGFRNSAYEGKALVLTQEWLNNPPEKGRLEFDFININHVNMSDMEISNFRLFRIMQGLGMVHEEKRRRIFDKLAMDREEGRAVARGSGYRPHSEMRTNTMEQASNFLHNLYSTYASGRAAFVEQPISDVERQFLHPTQDSGTHGSSTASGTAAPTPMVSPKPSHAGGPVHFPPTPKGHAAAGQKGSGTATPKGQGAGTPRADAHKATGKGAGAPPTSKFFVRVLLALIVLIVPSPLVFRSSPSRCARRLREGHVGERYCRPRTGRRPHSGNAEVRPRRPVPYMRTACSAGGEVPRGVPAVRTVRYIPHGADHCAVQPRAGLDQLRLRLEGSGGLRSGHLAVPSGLAQRVEPNQGRRPHRAGSESSRRAADLAHLTGAELRRARPLLARGDFQGLAHARPRGRLVAAHLLVCRSHAA